jgi:hypothetical protein
MRLHDAALDELLLWATWCDKNETSNIKLKTFCLSQYNNINIKMLAQHLYWMQVNFLHHTV